MAPKNSRKSPRIAWNGKKLWERQFMEWQRVGDFGQVHLEEVDPQQSRAARDPRAIVPTRTTPQAVGEENTLDKLQVIVKTVSRKALKVAESIADLSDYCERLSEQYKEKRTVVGRAIERFSNVVESKAANEGCEMATDPQANAVAEWERIWNDSQDPFWNDPELLEALAKASQAETSKKKIKPYSCEDEDFSLPSPGADLGQRDGEVAENQGGETDVVAELQKDGGNGEETEGVKDCGNEEHPAVDKDVGSKGEAEGGKNMETEGDTEVEKDREAEVEGISNEVSDKEKEVEEGDARVKVHEALATSSVLEGDAQDEIHELNALGLAAQIASEYDQRNASVAFDTTNVVGEARATSIVPEDAVVAAEQVDRVVPHEQVQEAHQEIEEAHQEIEEAEQEVVTKKQKRKGKRKTDVQDPVVPGKRSKRGAKAKEKTSEPKVVTRIPATRDAQINMWEFAIQAGDDSDERS